MWAHLLGVKANPHLYVGVTDGTTPVSRCLKHRAKGARLATDPDPKIARIARMRLDRIEDTYVLAKG